ncbi:MAG: hypothetical protein FRX49_12330 [Trebouxia sp. A1-2]|nr:MAG: hypothetical protein FRX49_12330 [Trebouxia sp. A1-2]
MHCKKPTEEVLMWILMYADDISLACDTAEKLRVAVTTMDATFLRWGLTVSTEKTKVLVVGRNAAAQAAESVITLRGNQLEVVSQFKYLGSVFTSDCTLDAKMTHRVTAANSAFQQLRRLLMAEGRKTVYQALHDPAATYITSCWFGHSDLVAEDDVGLVVAKTVTDSCTPNRTIAILANALTQHNTIATWKELRNKTPDRKMWLLYSYMQR